MSQSVLELPILQRVAPRLRPAGHPLPVRLPQPEYSPAPLRSRPFAAEIEEWRDVARTTPLLELGARAHALRLERTRPGVVTYIVDRNVNYTNLCVTDCKFCAFYRPPQDPEAYVLSYEEIGAKIDEAKALGAVQV
ncbi:MAG: hypothetical protein HY701_02630, partial [Gemmatimonadetes bacterium]|nr:hypothetical protein [Gemmatimonadota bacterium]